MSQLAVYQSGYYDVKDFRKKPYQSMIDPVAQLIKVDARVHNTQIVGRFCTGFNINNEGLFLTAGHCLTQGDTCRSLVQELDTPSYRISFNYHSDAKEDIYSINSFVSGGPCVATWGDEYSVDYALLQLSAGASQKYGYLPPVIGKVSPKQDATVVSHPKGKYKCISFGQVQESKIDGLIDHTAYIEPGSSGSPFIQVCNIRNRSVPCALGVNVRVSTTDDKVDHKHHYALPMSSIIKSDVKGHIGRVSHVLAKNGIFSYSTVQSNRLESIDLASVEQINEKNSSCCS